VEGSRGLTENWPDRRFRELTPELLRSISADDVGAAIMQHVAIHTEDLTDDARLAVIRELPAGTRAIYATWVVDAEVNNGGFNQFFFNPSGELAGLALAGYELMGAEEYATVMRAAIATYESERDTLAPFHRDRSLESFSESYRHTALGEVDQRYYSLGDHIYNLWAVFVKTRPELFSSPTDP
jgi:hypothetical protein